MSTKKYKQAKYSVTAEFAKSPNDVFQHLIDLSKWWPEDFEGESIKPESEFIFKSGDSHYSKNKVVEFIPDKKIIWLVTESIRRIDNFEWTGTKMIFELEPNGEHTQLKFTYDGPVLEDESERLVQICDLTIKSFFHDFLINGKKNNVIENG